MAMATETGMRSTKTIATTAPMSVRKNVGTRLDPTKNNATTEDAYTNSLSCCLSIPAAVRNRATITARGIRYTAYVNGDVKTYRSNGASVPPIASGFGTVSGAPGAPIACETWNSVGASE